MRIYSLTDFADEMRILSDSFDLSDGEMKVGRTRGGGLVRAQNGTRLWRGSITLAPHYPREMREVDALVRALQEPDAFFEIVDPFAGFPAADPAGLGLPDDIRIIEWVSDDGRLVDVSDLPDGYALGPGDRFSVEYPASLSTVRGYHEIRSTTTAAGGLAQLEVSPAIGTAAVGHHAEFRRPRCLAMIVPGSVRSAIRSRGIEQGVSFEWQQVLTTS